MPIGEGVLLLAGLVWAALLISYFVQVVRHPAYVRNGFLHPVQGGTPGFTGNLDLADGAGCSAAIPVRQPGYWPGAASAGT